MMLKKDTTILRVNRPTATCCRAMDMCVKDLSSGTGQDIQTGLIMALAGMLLPPYTFRHACVKHFQMPSAQEVMDC